ncbi:DUF3693 domain-containing protein [Stenotrophomonas maltophilia]|uniref:DUF3693 domain-containing protein n=1 Tax=Stenotrophomonas maltophilia TaxID=40324 RepID=UPI003D2F7278
MRPFAARAVWRKLAAAAMAVCLAVGFALPQKAQAAVAGFDKPAVYTLCEISYWSAVGFVGSCLPAGSPTRMSLQHDRDRSA